MKEENPGRFLKGRFDLSLGDQKEQEDTNIRHKKHLTKKKYGSTYILDNP